MLDLDLDFRPLLLGYSLEYLRNKVKEKTRFIHYTDFENSDNYYGGKSIPTEKEQQALFNIMYGALLTIRWRDNSTRTALDTATVIAKLSIIDIDAYASVYYPLRQILAELKAEANGENKKENF